MTGVEGRVAIVTGAGRGLGREYAMLLGELGAKVVVNDRGSLIDGSGEDPLYAEEVAAEIRAKGGAAVASAEDVAAWGGGAQLVRTAVGAFGRLDVLINSAGILRDRLIVNMTEEEWDTVMAVQLKGHFVPLRHAATYWRDQAKSGTPVAASVVTTSSTSGLFGNPGQANYGAAKAGVAALTLIAAQELGRYGVRVNAIVPSARTRLTESTPGLGPIVAAPTDVRFDDWDPANVAPLVAWLASATTTVSGRVLYMFGGEIAPMAGWSRGPGIESPTRWTVEEIDERLPPLLA